MKQCKTCGEVYETEKTCPCPKHGGARAGAGKPAQFKKPMKRREVTLDEETINFYLTIGKGNLSKGIRQYWRSLTKRAADDCPQGGLHNFVVINYPSARYMVECSKCGHRR